MKYLGLFLVGFVCAWFIQGIRWVADVAKMDAAYSQATAIKATEVSNQLLVSWAQTEDLRKLFTDYKDGAKREIAKLESDVAAGTRGLRVKATCGLPTSGAVPGGTGSGPAELDASARQDYYALRQGLSDQLAQLNFCRAELKKRSQ